MPPKPKTTYWKQYDLLYKNYSKKTIYKKLKRECHKVGLPFKKKDKRGRKPKFSAYTYAAFICFQKLFRHRYREMELEATLYIQDKVDHSTFARNYAKIPEEYIEKLIQHLVEREFIYWIADSTCISTKIRVERTVQGVRNKVKLRDKYHVLIGYDPPTHATCILAAKATDEHVSDSGAATAMLEGRKSNAYFMGDGAYNSYALHDKVAEVGLRPCIKPDEKFIRKRMSAKARQVKLFSKKKYREIRGIVETVFGGATNAGLILSYAKNEHTRRLDTLILALRHNLMASMRLAYWFFVRQTSGFQNIYKERGFSDEDTSLR